MPRPMPPYALWLDLETTGTNERTGLIIEIGCVLTHTDPGLREVARFSEVVQDASADVARAMMTPEVVAMHEANGLLAALAYPGGETSDIVEHGLLDWLEAHTDGGSVALAGSGVAHFDSRWLQEHMPRIRGRLTYWALDVGSLRRFGRIAGITLGMPETKNHRALADAVLHAEEARQWISILGGSVARLEAAS